MGKKNGAGKKGGLNSNKAAELAAKEAAENAALEAALKEAVAEEIALNAVVRVDNDIDATKPKTDKKTYRLIELINGIECLLVHDSDDEESDDEDSDGENPEMKDDESDTDDDAESEDEEGGGGDEKRIGNKRAAAAMAVGVGSWADPPKVQGLAHFLEHMLFMGNSKYPKENEYDSLVQRYGGTTNAFTECEHTVYHFEVYPRKFHEVLDVFAQFFIGTPLFRQDAVEREIQSIESEFVQTRNSDEARMDELLCRAAPVGHPYGNFTWGNEKSLIDEPKAAGINLHSELRKFYDDYYHPKRMKLVMTSSQSLDEMEQLVARTFVNSSKSSSSSISSNIPPQPTSNTKKKKSSKPISKSKSKLCQSDVLDPLKIDPLDLRDAMCKLVLVAAVSEVHELRLTWPLSEQLSNWRSKPADLVAHLIGHESAGSALSVLRRKGYANELSAGIGDSGLDSSTCCAMFRINITLTNIGLSNWLQVLNILFQYIELVRKEGVQKWVFDEVAAITEMGYEFREEDEAADMVEDLAVLMLPSMQFKGDVLRGSELLFEWNPTQMENILSVLRPDNCRLEILSSNFSKKNSIDHNEILFENKNKNILDQNEKHNEEEDDDDKTKMNHFIKEGVDKKRDFSKLIDDEQEKDEKVEKVKESKEDEKEVELPFSGIGCNCRNRKSNKFSSLNRFKCENPLCLAMFSNNSNENRQSSDVLSTPSSSASYSGRAGLSKKEALFRKASMLVQGPPISITPSIEPRFGTKYWEFVLEEDYINHWKISQWFSEDHTTEQYSLSLPQRNPFVATCFDLKYTEKEKEMAIEKAIKEENAFHQNIKIDFNLIIKQMNKHHLNELRSLEEAENHNGSGGNGKKNKSNIPIRNKEDRPVASSPGPPFLKPSNTPTPVVPTCTYLLASSSSSSPSSSSTPTSTTATTSPSLANHETTLEKDQSLVEVWHLNGYSYPLPRLEVYLRFTTPVCNNIGIKECVASELYTMIFNDYIAERSYLASMAGIEVSCKNNESGIVLHYSGFSDMLPLFIQETWTIFLQLPSLLSSSLSSSSSSSSSSYDHKKRFRSCKERLEKLYLNYYLKPSKHANRMRLSILKLVNSYQPNIKLKTLLGEISRTKTNFKAHIAENKDNIKENKENIKDNEDGDNEVTENTKKEKEDDNEEDEEEEEEEEDGITLKEMVHELMPKILKQGRVQLFVSGNASTFDVKELSENIRNEMLKIQIDPLPQQLFPKQPLLNLNSNNRIHVIVCSDDQTQNNSACELYWQIGPDCLLHRVLVDVIEQLMSEALFDTLRTKEQLGYSVSCGARWTNGILGFGVHVLSNSHTPTLIANRIFQFLQKFRFSLNYKNYEKEYEDEFRQQCESLVAIKLEKCTNLYQETSEHWEIISQCRTNINSHHELNRAPSSTFSTSSSSTNFAFLQNRTEALVIPKVTLSTVRTAMDCWFGFLPEKYNINVSTNVSEPKSMHINDDAEEAEHLQYNGGSHLGVFCLGRAAKHNTENESVYIPSVGTAQVDISPINDRGNAQSWEGPVEDINRAFVDYGLYPCFVSGSCLPSPS